MNKILTLSLFIGVLGVYGQNTNTFNVKGDTNFTTFTVTAYCSCEKCCGKWSKYNKTANGQTPKQGITCAASRKIPFNTKLQIENVGVRIVQDRLAVKYDERIDIYFTNHNDALKFGKKQLKVKKLN